jgi:hypothetical protein
LPDPIKDEGFVSKENEKMVKCAKCLTFTRKSECFISKENKKWPSVPNA